MKKQYYHCVLATLILCGGLWAHDHSETEVVVETLAKTTQSWDGETLPPLL